jgi:alpha,alpha-trehalose phosphorylase
MRDDGGELSFRPTLPERWDHLRFRLTIRDQRLEVRVDREGTTYTLTEGSGLLLRHEDEEFRVSADAPVRFDASDA